MKLKTMTKRKCSSGETYLFINGVADVPGMRDGSGKPYKITLREFTELNENRQKEETK